jgi:hypothetical protein
MAFRDYLGPAATQLERTAEAQLGEVAAAASVHFLWLKEIVPAVRQVLTE